MSLLDALKRFESERNEKPTAAAITNALKRLEAERKTKVHLATHRNKDGLPTTIWKEKSYDTTAALNAKLKKE